MLNVTSGYKPRFLQRKIPRRKARDRGLAENEVQNHEESANNADIFSKADGEALNVLQRIHLLCSVKLVLANPVYHKIGCNL